MTHFFEKNKRAISMLVVLAVLAAVFVWGDVSITSAETNTETSESIETSSHRTNGNSSKDEVIYANLEPSGALENMFVVNVLDVDNSGIGTDYGEYTEVVNLTDTSEINNSDGKISVTTSPGKFYYEGYGAESELPWIVNIDYSLDGTPINAEDLAGASGKLKINITTKANSLADEVFYDNYMLQISVPMNMDKADNIDSGGGTEGLSGGTKLINYTVLPGNDADYSLSADINDFEMSSIQISAIPFSMDFDLGDLTSQFDELVGAVAQLEEGMSSLDKGIESADKGLKKLKSGSSKLNKGLKNLNAGTAMLAQSSNGVAQGLNSMSTLLSQNINPNDINYMVESVSTMAIGLNQMSTGLNFMLSDIKNTRDNIPSRSSINLDDLGNSTTGQAIRSYIEGANAFIDKYDGYYAAMTGISTSIGAISTGLSTMASKLEGLKLIGSLPAALGKLSGEYSTFNTYLQTYFVGVNSIASQYGQMNSGISQTSKGMTKMADGSGELAKGMSQFNDSVSDIPDQIQEQIDGLMGGGDFEAVSFVSDKNSNINSVQFVLTTSKIEKEKIVKEESEDAGKESILDKILGLFR